SPSANRSATPTSSRLCAFILLPNAVRQQATANNRLSRSPQPRATKNRSCRANFRHVPSHQSESRSAVLASSGGSHGIAFPPALVLSHDCELTPPRPPL